MIWLDFVMRVRDLGEGIKALKRFNVLRSEFGEDSVPTYILRDTFV